MQKPDIVGYMLASYKPIRKTPRHTLASTVAGFLCSQPTHALTVVCGISRTKVVEPQSLGFARVLNSADKVGHENISGMI